MADSKVKTFFSNLCKTVKTEELMSLLMLLLELSMNIGQL